jgi:hypothetical protein
VGGSDPERPRLAGDSDDDDPALAGADPVGSDRAVGQAFGWYRPPYVDDDPRSQRRPSCGIDGRLVVQAMFRRANAIPPKRAEPRKRCTRGWKGQSCKRRTCEVCGVVWARDWRRVLFEALQAPGVPVVLSAVTPPGADELPWDEWHCRHLGPHRHSARLGCRVEGEALAQWSKDISKRWKVVHNGARLACKREMGRCLPHATRAWEPQRRGPGHVHPVFHVYSPGDLEVPGAISGTWRDSARGTASGSSERNGARACSSCRATARRRTSRATSFAERARRRRCMRTRGIPSAPNADLGIADPHAADRSHDAEPSSLSPAVGGAHWAFCRERKDPRTRPPGRPPLQARSLRYEDVAPQSGQKWKTPLLPSSETRMYCREAPSVVTCSASNRAWTPKTLPVRRWQARQWQIETRSGSPSTVSRSCSQLHAACRVLASGIVDRVCSATFPKAQAGVGLAVPVAGPGIAFAAGCGPFPERCCRAAVCDW